MNIKNRIIKVLIINTLCISLLFINISNIRNLNQKNNNEVEKVDVNTKNLFPTAGVSNTMYNILQTTVYPAEISKINIELVTSPKDTKTTEEIIAEEESYQSLYTEVPEYQMYINCYSGLRVRNTPNTESKDNIIGVLPVRTKVTIIGESYNDWAVINFNDQIAYICKDYLQELDPEYDTYNHNWSGKVLNNTNGKVYGPSGYETYYNLPMDGCVKLMNHLGYYGTIWVRSDGVKMWDEYVMVAADLSIHPKGSLVETSLGTGIVVDTGDFAHNGSGVSLDIATAW